MNGRTVKVACLIIRPRDKLFAAFHTRNPTTAQLQSMVLSFNSLMTDVNTIIDESLVLEMFYQCVLGVYDGVRIYNLTAPNLLYRCQYMLIYSEDNLLLDALVGQFRQWIASANLRHLTVTTRKNYYKQSVQIKMMRSVSPTLIGQLRKFSLPIVAPEHNCWKKLKTRLKRVGGSVKAMLQLTKYFFSCRRVCTRRIHVLGSLLPKTKLFVNKSQLEWFAWFLRNHANHSPTNHATGPHWPIKVSQKACSVL